VKSILFNRQQHRHLLVLLAAVFYLSACSSSPQAPISNRPLPAQERERALDNLQQYQLNAAISVKSPTENVSGTLSWQQQNNYYQAQLTNFLGITVFHLTTSAQGVLVEVDGQQHHAQNASALLDYLSGWSLPIEEMQLWLKGLPGPSSEDLQYDAMGRLTSFTLLDSQQRRWQVKYSEFHPDALSLPKKMQLQSPDTRLKLLIKNWQLQ